MVTNTKEDDETTSSRAECLVSHALSPLPLYTSKSVPILYRSTSSFSVNSGYTNANALENGNGDGVCDALKNAPAHALVHGNGNENRNHSDDHCLVNDADAEDSSSQNSNSESNVEHEDDINDDDTFENACDIEDQATTSSVSMSMNSFSAMKRARHMNTQDMSSDSEDATPYNALFYAGSGSRSRSLMNTNRQPSYSHILEETDSGSTISSKNSSRHSMSKMISNYEHGQKPQHQHQHQHQQQHGKIRRSDNSSSTVSSLGTFSKHKYKRPHLNKHAHEQLHGHEHDHGVGKPQMPMQKPMLKIKERKQQKVHSSCILAIIKALALFWVISALTFLFYHVYIYNPSSSLTSSSLSSLSPLAKLTPGISHDYGSSFNHIPFPPPPEQKISVVLMNHSRPRMIKESTLVPTLLHHPSIEEVILLHSNPKTSFKFVHPKVVNIDASQENDQMGLSLRFYFCQLAKNDWVLHIDDDMEFTEKTLNEMLSEFSKNTKRIVGRFGRNRKENSYFNGYSSKDTSKESEVILTKFMVMERETCSAFFKYSHLIWEDIILNNGEGPLWNGEDVFMSLVSNHIYGALSSKVNYAMNWLDVRSAPEELKDYTNGKFDISGGFDGLRFWDFGWWRSLLNRNRHYSYRGTLWKEAMERLKQVDLASEDTKVGDAITLSVKKE